ncbi:MAG TPA: HAMP domain-containing protein [Candidatus Cybelea sp.]|jgi:HAMP domain-containing protein/CheY-like chemotaxis protein/signal transduction histidine kinase|nr:HAMP domain-containing protein [Candidatus Cybelea sp.]
MPTIARERESTPLGRRRLLAALRAFRRGDFSARLPRDLSGIDGEIAEAFNDCIELNASLARELERASVVVGREGRIAQRASLGAVGGLWQGYVDSVNQLITDLTQPMAEAGRVLGAVANGDLSQSMALDIEGRPLKGEFLRSSRLINSMVAQLNAFASELLRVAREVGSEGKLGGQAVVKGVAGTWKDLTESVNTMAGNLTNQVRNIADVTTAVANGDLSKKITVEARGEILELKGTINTMVDQLNAFASEVTRVAREVGSEGKLGGQAAVAGVGGTWKDLTDSVNTMAGNLTNQVRNIADVTTAVAKGDLSKKITVDVRGEILELKVTINTMVDQLNGFASEVTRVAREVGSEGKLGGQAAVAGVGGTWKDLTDSVNTMAGNLTSQVRNIAEVTTAVATGDLSKKITVDARGEILELKGTINTMVDQLNAFASEVTRVAREVGSEGRLGGQAEVQGVSGTWKDLTDSVNFMASNLTSQVRNIADVTTAVAKGDLSKKITVDVRGEILELKNTINTMVDQLNAFASEVTRVAVEVGSEGKLGGQAQVVGVSGTWKDLTDSVNFMASNLTSQVRNIADVTTAVANGDLSKKITVAVRGEILELKNTINTMVDQLNGFASEVTRVAREVGSEGRLGGQAVVKGVGGTWKDLTDSVNTMAGNLTNQVRNIAEVTTAVATGDLSKKITVDVRGEILELKGTINTMVDQLNAFASEVTRVAREVGSEGKLGGQAQVVGVSGTWKDLTDSVNFMASNLTSQVRNIADVTTAVANGDLSKKITVDVKGEIRELKDTINTMVDQLNAFASEVTRVAREVGSEGRLGGQAIVKGVGGTWKDLTDSVNTMAGNLTSQVRNIAEVTTAVATGDLSKKITVDVRGEILELKDTINTMVDQLNAFAGEVTRVAREVGSEGRLGGQAQVRGVAGTWKDLTDSVNRMASNLTSQVRNIAKVTTAVANGDLSKKITVDVAGEILELKDTINTMVDQLNAFASEVTRVAREVGSEGKLGGQAVVKGVSGTWKDLTDSVNFMASNLTSQVRGIAQVVTGVANGDLKRKLTLQAAGEIALLAETINGMIDTLATFADQVTTVAREVGFEGRLGGQAEVPGAAGLWRDLTDSVNQLAAQLTSQIRAIGEVATAVTKGDLSRAIEVEARGEVGELTENVNEMIQNLRDTTRKNTEQDWLKSNLARFTAMLQGERDIKTVSRLIMSEIAPLVDAQVGALYVTEPSAGEPLLHLVASYALAKRKSAAPTLRPGEGLVGQCFMEKRRILLTEVPSDYITIGSGIGSMRPVALIVLPVLFEGDVKAVMELASARHFSETHLRFLEQLTESIGVTLNTIAASMRTEELLKQSQALTTELQSQQMELQTTNDELEEKARLLQERNAEVERRTREIDEARQELERRAEQLALTSKYKSQFLANVSHELRTPLNSLLILSRQLSENAAGTMSVKEVEFARAIHGSGADLLRLINDILDLSKIESGTTSIDLQEIAILQIQDEVERTFDQIAQDKSLDFIIRCDEGLPKVLLTDPTRLQQILKNLLSNAFKFTNEGSVTLDITISRDHGIAGIGGPAVAFSVTDTGIGIPQEKFNVIFETFQQADMGTSRRFGGTGLGLAISREIAALLGGEISVRSTIGEGSTFTFFHPLERNVGTTTVQRTVAISGGVHERIVRPVPRTTAEEHSHGEIEDDREQIETIDRVLLIIEDDLVFARILLGLARDRGFKGIVALSAAQGLALARRFRPDAVTLDISLPDTDGWNLLQELKDDPTTADIPVHVISGAEQWQHALDFGAVTHLTKPVTEEALTQTFDSLLGYGGGRSKNLLLVEDDITQLNAMVNLIDAGEVAVTAVRTGAEAMQAIAEQRFDCIVVDLGLPDVSGEELIAQMRQTAHAAAVPIIVYTARDLTRQEELKLAALSETVIVKNALAPERLLDEARFFLNQVESKLPASKRTSSDVALFPGPSLAGNRVLIVDDDTRNIFALRSALEATAIEVLSAESGQEGIDLLNTMPNVDIALIDIMMPELDGYETIRRIRANPRFSGLPIIALTAKAMRGDRESCIAAGASEYISKPVDVDQLISLLRVWLNR